MYLNFKLGNIKISIFINSQKLMMNSLLSQWEIKIYKCMIMMNSPLSQWEIKIYKCMTEKMMVNSLFFKKKTIKMIKK